MRHLGSGWDSLNSLSVINCNIHDEDLWYFAELRALRFFSLANNSITGTGFRHLEGLDALEVLELMNNQIETKNCLLLARLPSLASLGLGHALRGNDFEFLGSLTHLRSLELQSNHITGSIFSNLTGMSLLRYLDLSHNYLSVQDFLGNTIDNINRLVALRVLDLRHNPLRDETALRAILEKLCVKDVLFNWTVPVPVVRPGFLRRQQFFLVS